MRLFIASKIENQRVFEILELLEKIPGVKVVKKENLHITYKFIGESEEIEKYKELIDESVKNIKKFDIKIAGIDAFYDSFGNIKVIYAIPKSEELTNLGKNFDENFKPFNRIIIKDLDILSTDKNSVNFDITFPASSYIKNPNAFSITIVPTTQARKYRCYTNWQNCEIPSNCVQTTEQETNFVTDSDSKYVSTMKDVSYSCEDEKVVSGCSEMKIY